MSFEIDWSGHQALYAEDTGSGLSYEYLRWRKPGTSIYGIEYLASGRNLYVSGDCDSAVYEWPERISLEWVASCQTDYIASKCTASPDGRGFRRWDGEAFRTAAMAACKGYDTLPWIQARRALRDADVAFRIEAATFMEEHPKVFDDIADCLGWGNVISPSCHAQIEGLQHAVRWLQDQGRTLRAKS